MAKAGKKFIVLRSIASGFLLTGSVIVYAERGLKQETTGYSPTPEHIAEMNYLLRVVNFLWQKGQQGYVHVWPAFLLIFFSELGDKTFFIAQGLSKTISMAAHILDSVVILNDRSLLKFTDILEHQFRNRKGRSAHVHQLYLELF
ncbi:hypothetical protein POM88_004109 [Heracleum sosnowskyi]|uniref:GDT1 family protein n=1 Tax=Heracleum sosnowskyi TaxID=360622 RepID=A0AAD8JJ74_9APIA|nr:hypothetical protein POM88_004109 [Heracleum sosnowskyi]